jgi:peptide deformylase|tara:strand:+ start:24037 stop:24489 length:453 start_codon:yes stop_codon:yes gene_type:complete
MKYNIVKNKERLSKPCNPCKDLEFGLKTGADLLGVLAKSGDGVGLAANQIGINSRVCVIHVNEPIILINPSIVGKFRKILFQEGCLSFPGDYIITERYENIMVKADNYQETLFFDKKNILECVCVQHEIDHLDGITMFDRKVKGDIYEQV